MNARLKQTLTLLAMVAAFSPLAGCSSMRDRVAASPRPKTSKGADAEQFFASWNGNVKKIDSVLCDSVDVDGSSQGQSYPLRGKLAFQQPNRFRMLGKFAGNSEVDLGSNEDTVWFWIRRAEPPAVYFCNREELKNVKMALPFQPDWIVEALGVRPLNPDEYRETPGTPDYLLLVADAKSPAGESILKRVVVDRQTGQVEAFEIYSHERKLLAKAQVLEYSNDLPGQVYLPRKIRILWPDADTKLTISLSRRATQVNTLSQELASSLFTFRPDEYVGARPVDLARAARQASSSPREDGLRAQAPPAAASPAATLERAEDPSDPVVTRRGRYDSRVQPARAAQLTGQIEPATAPAFGPNR